MLGQNTEYFAEKPRPILYGIAVEVHGGYSFPAKFMYKVSLLVLEYKNSQQRENYIKILYLGTRNRSQDGQTFPRER